MDLKNLKEKIAVEVRGAGYDLYDVELVRENKRQILRVTIDKSEGYVDIDDCIAVNDRLNPKLDEWDPIPTEYYLEVSSPGAERDLRTSEEIRRALGEYVHLDTKNGPVEGVLVRLTDEEYCLKDKKGKETSIAVGDVKKIRLAIEL